MSTTISTMRDCVPPAGLVATLTSLGYTVESSVSGPNPSVTVTEDLDATGCEAVRNAFGEFLGNKVTISVETDIRKNGGGALGALAVVVKDTYLLAPQWAKDIVDELAQIARDAEA